MKFAYADPPYIGQAKRHYKCAEVDHAELIRRLDAQYEAWALSLSAPTLDKVLPLCPPGVRIGAWVKPFHTFKRNVNPSYGWEPLLFKGGRKRHDLDCRIPDFCAVNIKMQKGFVGAKPDQFCYWVFELLNARPGDDFHDLFLGSGAVSEAWGKWCSDFEELRLRRLKGSARQRFLRKLDSSTKSNSEDK